MTRFTPWRRWYTVPRGGSRRVLRFDAVFGREGCGSGSAAVYMPPLAAALPVAAKTKQPRFARRNAPLLPTAPLHGKASHEIFSRLMAPYKFRSLATPEGEVLAMQYFEMLIRPKI